MCKVDRILQSSLELAIYRGIEKKEVNNILVNNLEISTVLENRSVLMHRVIDSYIEELLGQLKCTVEQSISLRKS